MIFCAFCANKILQKSVAFQAADFFCGRGRVMANSELQTAITAEKANRYPIPKRTQIQPPMGADRIEIR